MYLNEHACVCETSILYTHEHVKCIQCMYILRNIVYTCTCTCTVYRSRYVYCLHLLLRKRDDPEQRRVPSAMIAILSPRRSASSLQEVNYVYLCCLLHTCIPSECACTSSYVHMYSVYIRVLLVPRHVHVCSFFHLSV